VTLPRDYLALMAAAATGVQVGAAMVATRYVTHDIGPASLALLRYSIAFICLLPFALAFRKVRVARGDLVAIAGFGILQFGVLIALLNIGLRYMPATRAALLFSTFPLLTMVVAAALGRERLTGTRTAGVLLTIAGVSVTLGEGLFVETRSGELTGALAVLGAALCGAVCSVLYRPYLQRCPTVLVGAIAMFASVIFLSGFAAMEGLFTDGFSIGVTGWVIVGFIGLSSGIGYLLWLWALKHASPTRVTVFLSLSPVTAAVLGVSVLGEPLTAGTLIGLAAVVGGLWVATRLPASEPAAVRIKSR
jgi:drug/metabolite transporter (DMT)-like permease